MSETNDTATKTATKVRDLADWTGDASLYKLSDGSYVTVSAVYAYSGPETLVFSSDKSGEPTSWGEIGGGRGYMDHAQALREMGYEVIQ